MPYTVAEVSNAIARANGQPLRDIRVGGLNGATAADLGPTRNVRAQGNNPYPAGRGHVYAHVASYTDRHAADANMRAIATAQGNKSLWINRHTAIAATHEMINSPRGEAGAFRSARNPPDEDNIWLRGIPLAGSYYGRERGANFSRRVTTGSINFRVIGHSLFIYSSYPDGFLAGAQGVADAPDFADLADLFA